VEIPIRFINPHGLSRPPTYTQVVEVTGPGRTIYISGQLGIGVDGQLVSGDFRAQAEQVFKNLEAALAAVGASFADIVKLNSYLRHIADLPILREVRPPSQSRGAAGQHHARGAGLRARRRLAGDRGGCGPAACRPAGPWRRESASEGGRARQARQQGQGRPTKR